MGCTRLDEIGRSYWMKMDICTKIDKVVFGFGFVFIYV